MIGYISLGHPILKQKNPPLYRWWWSTLLEHKFKFEALSGEPCLIIHVDHLTSARIAEIDPSALLISGCFTEFEQYDPAALGRLKTLIRETERPLMGMCAGMSLISEAFGGQAGPIGFGDPADPDLQAVDHIPAGAFREHGFCSIELTTEHPLTAGMPRRPTVYQTHYWQVTTLPDRFEHLGRSELVDVQIFAHPTRPIFATQFHPEQFDQQHPDGSIMLENFFQIANGQRMHAPLKSE